MVTTMSDQESFCGEERVSKSQSENIDKTIKDIESLLTKRGLSGIVFLVDDKSEDDDEDDDEDGGMSTSFMGHEMKGHHKVAFAIDCITEKWFPAAVKAAISARQKLKEEQGED